MMYSNCPNCGAQNRASDEKCYSCQGSLAKSVEEAPDAGALARPEKIVAPPRMNDRESNWKEGLVAGLKVGGITGICWGAYGAFFGATVASAATSKVGVLGAFGAAVFMSILITEVVYCAIIGLIAGALNILCYRYDAMKVGTTVGVIYSLLNFSFLGVFWAAAYGSLVGWWCCHAEKLRRGQYSEI